MRNLNVFPLQRLGCIHACCTIGVFWCRADIVQEAPRDLVFLRCLSDVTDVLEEGPCWRFMRTRHQRLIWQVFCGNYSLARLIIFDHSDGNSVLIFIVDEVVRLSREKSELLHACTDLRLPLSLSSCLVQVYWRVNYLSVCLSQIAPSLSVMLSWAQACHNLELSWLRSLDWILVTVNAIIVLAICCCLFALKWKFLEEWGSVLWQSHLLHTLVAWQICIGLGVDVVCILGALH